MRQGEEPLLRQIFTRAVHGTASAHYSAVQCKAWAPEQFDMARWVSRMQQSQPIVVEDGGVLAGFSDIQKDGYIDMFFVDPAYGRSGVGNLLMDEIHARARQRGIISLHSHVSLSAQAFFSRHGFQVAERKSVLIGDIALDNALMTKQLQA